MKGRQKEEGVSRCPACPVREGCCFSAVPDFRAAAESRFYGRHFTLFRQGDEAEHFQKVRRGWLQLTHTAANGKAVVDFAGPASVFGVVELLTGAPFDATVQTLEDCEMEVTDGKTFLKLVEQNPTVSAGMLRCLSRQLQRANHLLYDVVGKVPSEQRLLAVLREIAETRGSRSANGTQIRLPLTVQDLAEKIGCSRQWTSKLIGKLHKAGLLERNGGWIVITSAGISSGGGASLNGESGRGLTGGKPRRAPVQRAHPVAEHSFRGKRKRFECSHD